MNQKKTEKDRDKDNEKKPLNEYLKYSGLAMQMGITIGLATWAGVSLDAYFGFDKVPVFTLILVLLSIFASLYVLIRQLTR